MYFIFGAFAEVMGTALSILIRLELSNPGNQLLIENHQLYNVKLFRQSFFGFMLITIPSNNPSVPGGGDPLIVRIIINIIIILIILGLLIITFMILFFVYYTFFPGIKDQFDERKYKS